MATYVATDAYLTVNSVDLSDRVKSLTLTYEAEMQDDTTMGAGTRTMIPGLKNWSLEVTFVQDFASGEVDATIWSLVGASAFALAVRPTSDTIATANPEFQMNGIVESYPILDNKVGEISETTVKFVPSGASPAMVRDTTP